VQPRAVFKGGGNGFKPPPPEMLGILMKDVATRCVLRAVNESETLLRRAFNLIVPIFSNRLIVMLGC